MTEPTIEVRIDQTIQPKPFESAHVGIALSGVPVGTSVEEIEAMLDTGRIMFDCMRERLQAKVATARKNWRSDDGGE